MLSIMIRRYTLCTTTAIVMQCAVRVWRSVRIVHRKQQVRLKLQALEHEAVERIRKELASSTIAVAWRACLLRYAVSSDTTNTDITH
jgi:hypothetical protein